MKKNVICIDLDDTISDTYSTVMQYAKRYDIEHLGGKGEPLLVENSGDHYYFARMLNWNREQLISFFNDCYFKYLQDIKVKCETKKIISQLKELGFYICIITARREKENNIVYKITANWLKKNHIEYDKLIVNCTNKGKYVEEMNSCIFLDDSYENCLDVRKCSPYTKVFLMDTIYNSRINNLEKNGIQRINSLSEFYNKVRSIKDE